MAFSSYLLLLRSICRKGSIFRSTSTYCNFVKWSARSGACVSEAVQGNQDSSSPWLMLTPEFEGGGTMSYTFYSLADNKVQIPSPSDAIRHLKLTCRGSSHGWLALLRPHHDDFFLYNPITRRHIMLPSIMNLPRSPRDVKKLILSCSPDEDKENCRAVMITKGYVLAFCCPGRSKEWTVFSDENSSRTWEDCVYSVPLKLLFVNSNDRKLESWDLGDISSPKLINIANWNRRKGHFSSSVMSRVKIISDVIEYLVVAGEDLLLVTRYLMEGVGPDGQCYGSADKRRPDHVDEDDPAYFEKRSKCPVKCNYMTIGFDIWKHDSEEKGKFEYLDSSSLGDLALFVGMHNHGIAIKATDFPGVKPGSVYFTDGYYSGSLEGGPDDGSELSHCGHDIGIYNYKDKTVSPCYYPCDAPSLKTILPAPIWYNQACQNWELPDRLPRKEDHRTRSGKAPEILAIIEDHKIGELPSFNTWNECYVERHSYLPTPDAYHDQGKQVLRVCI
ncbi:hypothetical protein CASFOL_026876 [Castilleja foliolosa]|uniref:KIB1-4 beta-propeller domain-containing protein n=1 Tax=Castilleja foliolosa TaxID=1961234 RepID=A0ABD3CJB9_9LAMI